MKKLSIQDKAILEDMRTEPLRFKEWGMESEVAEKGLSGLISADSTLKRMNTSGVLIGRVSEKIWQEKSSDELLRTSKDVDVAVLDKNFSSELDYSEGIDWYFPNNIRVVHTMYERPKVTDINYWQNQDGVMLRFGLKKSSEQAELSPGLYIPSREWVTSMRYAEAYSIVDTDRVVVHDRVEEEYKKTKRQEMKEELPGFVSERFGDRITCNEPIRVDPIELNTLNAIKYFLGIKK
ncbi:hypothetical protein GOV05_03770 [Candidatus Woesearchaeota archaeon]|nr:hypothetical protein [Candidatus Woesearchaeota archaeon]